MRFCDIHLRATSQWVKSSYYFIYEFENYIKKYCHISQGSMSWYTQNHLSIPKLIIASTSFVLWSNDHVSQSKTMKSMELRLSCTNASKCTHVFILLCFVVVIIQCLCGKLWYLQNNCVGDTIVYHLAVIMFAGFMWTIYPYPSRLLQSHTITASLWDNVPYIHNTFHNRKHICQLQRPHNTYGYNEYDTNIS